MLCALAILAGHVATLTVGPGREFRSIEAAVTAAMPGDTVEVYPSPDHYAKAHVMVSKARLTIVGTGAPAVRIEGDDFDYSGEGANPRAIFQFDPGANGCTVRNFELSGARNGSFNGAGVRINQAKNVTVANCDIHDNDMGIMSNGRDGDEHAAENQTIGHCAIHGNGSTKDPGYSHNLYLGGTSVTVQFCDIYGSVAGHNLKSRAHYSVIRYCFIHDSSNRELDFVDAWDTERPHSNVVLLGNVIVKSPKAENKMVIHFGQERGSRVGDLYMVNNTVSTPFLGPVISCDAPAAMFEIFNNVFANTEQANPILLDSIPHSNPLVRGANWLSRGYMTPNWSASSFAGDSRSASPFAPGSDYRLAPSVASLKTMLPAYGDGLGVLHQARPTYRYMGEGKWEPTAEWFLGAG